MIEGRHYQNAYVTRNLAKAVDEFAARASARSVVTFEATTEVLTGHGRKNQTLKLGFVWVGDLQYEFIEPLAEAVPVFSGWLPDGPGRRLGRLPPPRRPAAMAARVRGREWRRAEVPLPRRAGHARPLPRIHLDDPCPLGPTRRPLTVDGRDRPA